MKITNELMTKLHIKQVWPPTRLGVKYAKNGVMKKGQKLLVAILDTPYGPHFKEVYDQFILDAVRQNPIVSARYYALNAKQVEAVKDVLNRPTGRTS